jgi:hypothetical protein
MDINIVINYQQIKADEMRRMGVHMIAVGAGADYNLVELNEVRFVFEAYFYIKFVSSDCRRSQPCVHGGQLPESEQHSGSTAQHEDLPRSVCTGLMKENHDPIPVIWKNIKFLYEFEPIDSKKQFLIDL